MIDIKDLTFTYSGANKPAVENINLHIDKGQFVLLLGASGCGKTTITRLINGLVYEFYEGDFSGDVVVDGNNTKSVYISQISNSVGSVFQDPSSQFFTTDTTSELVFSCENHSMDRQQIIKNLNDVVQKLDLELLLDRDVFKLSSGQKQMIAIGSICAYSPNILVFDEPSANLDGVATKRLCEIMTTLKNEGFTIIVAEHKIHYLRHLCDRAILFKDGRIAQELGAGDINKLSNDQAHLLGLRSCDLEALEIDTTPHAAKSALEDNTSQRLEIQNLEFFYKKDSPILNKFSCSLEGGQVIGLVGKNGQGKTTLMEIICGLRKPGKGSIKIDGKLAGNKQRQDASYLVMQTSEYQLFSNSVEGELHIDAAQTNSCSSGVAYKDSLLEQLQLDELRECHPMSLSGGQKQRLCIAVACYKDASIICLDEPTSGLDYKNMCVVADILKDLASQGKTVIVASHDYEFIIKCCQKILFTTSSGQSRIIPLNNNTKSQVYDMLLGRNDSNFMKKDKAVHTPISLLMKFIKPCVGKEILAVIFATISVAGAIVPYYCAFQIFDQFFDQNLTQESAIYWVAIAAAGVLVRALGHSISTCLAHISAYTILENIRLFIADKLMKTPLGSVQNQNIGKLKSLIVDHVETLELPLAHLIPEAFAAFVMPLSVFGYMCTIDIRLALISLITIPLGVLPFIGSFKDYNKNYDSYMRANDTMNGVIVEYVEGVEVIKAFNQTSTSYEKLSGAINHFHKTTMDWFSSTYKPRAFMNVMMPSTVLGVLPLGLYLYITQNLDPSVLLISILLCMGIVSCLTKFTLFLNDFKAITYAISEVISSIDSPELLQGTKDNQVNNSTITLENLSFSYLNQDDSMVLRNISTTFEAGKYYALVGPSGSGKSTIARLIARYWDSNSGTISIGGVDTRDMSLGKLADMISFVTQDNYLFNTTIFENIKMGNGNASDEQVYAAAKSAACDEFISRLENGYMSFAGEAGTKLSGGERQRIALARAILKDAPIVILDEATAFADPENEASIQKSIAKLTQGKTLIVIAHRLSTITNADKILLINKGQIEASGTHASLLASNSLYKTMWDMHISAKNWAVSSNAKSDGENAENGGKQVKNV